MLSNIQKHEHISNIWCLYHFQSQKQKFRNISSRAGKPGPRRGRPVKNKECIFQSSLKMWFSKQSHVGFSFVFVNYWHINPSHLKFQWIQYHIVRLYFELWLNTTKSTHHFLSHNHFTLKIIWKRFTHTVQRNGRNSIAQGEFEKSWKSYGRKLRQPFHFSRRLTFSFTPNLLVHPTWREAR